ncbi:MAG TPA: 3-isopropylmalate dehydrogenase [Gammaproteobacteria bacterium]|nr:3-isopropylmalate dehydrogenase [Gammaproteobacteria bacterium]
MQKTIAVLAGDGIGPEVMSQAIRVLNTIADKFNHHFTLIEGAIGGAAFDKYNQHFPQETKQICEQSDAILFGSVGGPVKDAHLPKWQNCEKNSLLSLRKTLNLNANLRPAQIYPALQELSPLKSTLTAQGVDILIVRELIGDIYFGEHKQFLQNGIRHATDVAEYNEHQIASVAERSFQLARKRKQKITSVDKANVLDTSKLWREVVSEVAKKYPDVKCEHMLVDNCAMQLFINPGQFDVILTSNLFGDILSDAAAALPGSLGLMPSASLSESGLNLYEPSGGSAPDLTGQNIANPIAQILSVALMLRFSFDLYAEAERIETAIQKALNAGYRTRDIYSDGKKSVGTTEMTDAILQYC